jgi:uncharacterized delta-60 repeat protein
MLKIDFVESKPVAPAISEFPFTDGRAKPLTRVNYSKVWDGVDIVYETNEGSIVKSSYTVLPGKDPAAIRLRYNRPLTTDDRGNLVISYKDGRMAESKPVAWQIVKGKKKPVSVAYNLQSEKEVGFAVGDYDNNRPLVIDPSLTWNTFLGGSGNDSGWAMSVDANGNVYVTGYSAAAWGSPIRAYTAGWDCYVAKIAADGTLLWNTFLGGSGNYEYGQALAVDSSGSVYVAGGGDAAWGSPVQAYAGGWDCFVAKLTSDGALVWNTFLGASLNEGGRALAVDLAGNVYVSGYSEETWGSPRRPYTGKDDAFVAKLNPNGSLAWNTFLGGNGNDSGWGMTVDSSGNVYVSGESGDAWGLPIRPYAANDDAFVAKIDPNGTLVWHTFLGGADSDYAFGIAMDASGFLYVAGQSYGSWGSPIRAYEALDDAYVAKLANDGTLIWNTFLGGSGSECGFAIAMDPRGFIYVAGDSDSTWGSPIMPYSEGKDVFAAKIGFDGTLVWNAFLGGGSWDTAYAIATDKNKSVYVAGWSWDAWGSPKRAYMGNSDGFVAHLSESNDASIAYFPQVVDGSYAGQWSYRTILKLSNRDSSGPASGSVSFYSEDGTPMNLSIQGNAGSQFPFTIPSSGSVQLETSGVGNLKVGWAKVQSDKSLSSISIFSFYDGAGRYVSEMGAPTVAAATSFSMFVEASSGIDTGISFANPNSSQAQVTLTLRNSQGVILGLPLQLTVPANGHTQKYVSEYFKGILPSDFQGTMDVASQIPVVGMHQRQRGQSFTWLPLIQW